MAFLSLHFLLFMALLFGLVQFAARSAGTRNNLLLAASYYFYMCWDWRFAALLLVNTLVNFHAARVIAASADPRRRRLALGVALAAGLGALGYFKYANFFIDSMNGLLRTVGVEADLPTLQLVLPLGISFFTFQSLSYTLDVHRGRQAPCDSLRDFALFVAFFPTVLSGPITRAHQILPQLCEKAPNPPEQVESGLVLMARGFVKKIAFADVLAAHLVDPAFADPGAFAGWFLVLAVWAYSFQIYMDLSGYTDIARGAARLLGLELPESFNRPYLASSVSNFWQRWHITMSGFFRDYLFFWLGGSKHGNVYANLVVTFVAIGLWHSAGWNFVVYGLIHGGLVAFERWLRHRRERLGLPPLPEHGWTWLLRVVLVFQVVAFSRILFRSPDLAGAGNFLAAIFAGSGQAAPLCWMGGTALALAAVLHYLPAGWPERLAERIRTAPALPQAAGLVAVTYGLVALVSGQPTFIYFKF